MYIKFYSVKSCFRLLISQVFSKENTEVFPQSCHGLHMSSPSCEIVIFASMSLLTEGVGGLQSMNLSVI